MYDVAVIGCGIVGAAIAYELSKYNLNVIILEKENDVAMGTTRANSAIIHAGYDPKPGTLMARLNVRGSFLTQEICKNLDIPYNQNGALVLGFDNEDKEVLEELLRRGIENGVPGLCVLDGNKVKMLEPNISDNVQAALYAPTSAICNPWEYCLAMVETAIKNGASLRLNSHVEGINRQGDTFAIYTATETIESKYVINAAGCEADKVHDMACGHSFDIMPNRGEYYLLDKCEGNQVTRTIFQCPSKSGKGVLISPTIHGNLIVGPNSECTSDLDTSTTAEGLKFVRYRAHRAISGIRFSQNIRNFAGIRAKSSEDDFIIREDRGFIDAAGICSPGLSAAPAIAEYVLELLANAGLKLTLKGNFINTRKRTRVKELSLEDRAQLIESNPSFGDVVCRCETITRGEILECFEQPIPPVSVDGVKRRVSSGMGRCQGGFCSPIIVEMLSERLGIDMCEVNQDQNGSNILFREEEPNV